jgi:regulatory protein
MKMDETEVRNAKFYALRLINLKPRSAEELKGKLKEKGIPENIMTHVLGEFKKKGLVDDKKFAKLWVNSRMASNPKGEKILRHELKEKGVEDDIISQTIEEAKNGQSEYDTVKKLADTRMHSLRELDKKTAKRRLFGYLKRRGFSFDVIMKVLNEEFN